MQAWQCAAHAEYLAQRVLAEQEAQEGIDKMGLDARPAGAPLSLPSLFPHQSVLSAGPGRASAVGGMRCCLPAYCRNILHSYCILLALPAKKQVASAVKLHVLAANFLHVVGLARPNQDQFNYGPGAQFLSRPP